MTLIRRNFVVEILTSTPRRWTPYRGVSPSGQRGLTVSSQFYQAHHVEVPEFAEETGVAPATVTIKIGNAGNEATDLVTDTTTRRAQITITEVKFDSSWAITSTKTWFIGVLGRPEFSDEMVMIECHADFGRRGPSPSKESSSLMHSHTPPAQGTNIPWFRG